MAQVFISYDREDRDFAEVVQAKLERAGHATAMDLDFIHAGDDWQDKIDHAIRGSCALVVVMTPQARTSDYVAYEWAFALGAGVTVIPIELVATSFSPRLESLQRLDFKDKARPWEVLLAEVKEAESKRPAAVTQAPDGASPVVERALRAIDSPNPGERRAAITTLAQSDEPGAREALARVLQHPVSSVRAAAAECFPDRKDPRIIEGLVDRYRDEIQTWLDERRGERRPTLAWEIAEIGAPAVPILASILERTGDSWADSALRKEILSVLGEIGDKSAAPTLIEALAGGDEEARRAAAEALGRLRDPSVAASLRSALSDDDRYVREYAVTSLGMLRDVDAVSDLVRILREESKRLRAASASALGRIGSKAALPALIEALEDDGSVQTAAVEALGQIGDPLAISHLRPLLENEPRWLGNSDLALMRSLVSLRDRESLAVIEKRIIGFQSGTRPDSVCEALAQWDPDGVRTLIRIVAKGTGDPVSKSGVDAAAKALSAIKSPEADAVLSEWRRSQD